MKYKTKNISVLATQLQTDTYFQKSLAHKGDYLVQGKDGTYLFPKDLFESVFFVPASCLQEAIDNKNREEGNTPCQSV